MTATVEDLHELQGIALRLQRSDIPQVQMLGVRVDALVQSLLDSTVVDERFLVEPEAPLERSGDDVSAG
jgi:hypothetical protein